MTSGRYAYIWEYTIDAGREAEFVAAYGADGEWVRLFRRYPGFLRTELLRDREEPSRFVTIDHWERREAWESFRAQAADEFEALDRRCESFTKSERQLGTFSY